MNPFWSKLPVQRSSFTSQQMDDDELVPMLGEHRSVNAAKDGIVTVKRPASGNGMPCVYIFLILIAALVALTLLLALILLVATVRLKTELINTRDATYLQIADNFKRFRENVEEVVNRIPAWSLQSAGRYRDSLPGGQLPQADDPQAIKAEVHYAAARKDSRDKQPESDPLCSRSCSNPRYERHPVVVISLDGFMHEYHGRNIVKTLDRFEKCGATAKWLYASYPTKTFPNHYTMATGLYPEAHGIIDNEVHDPALSDDLVDTRRTTDTRYFKGEPIWVTATKHNLTTACLFWAGCAVDFNGIRPTFNPPYDGTMSFKTRISKLMDWLLLPANSRPDLLMAYFSEPDYAGHFQHSDEQVNESLKDLESALDFLLDSLTRRNLLGCLNIIILSDHGMQKLDKRFYLDQMLDIKGMIVSSSVVARIELANSTMNKDQVVDRFRCKNRGTIYRIYDKRHIPKRYHYEASKRIGDFILEGQPGTAFYATLGKDVNVAADHGYDYISPNMRTVFYAAGPAIVSNKRFEPFQNVEIYNLIADLVGISDRIPNNGTYGRLHEILVNPPRSTVISTANLVRECSPTVLFRIPGAIACDAKCQKEEDALTSALTTCLHGTPNGHFGYADVNSPYCYVSLCSTTAIFASSRRTGQPRAIYEVLTRATMKKKREANGKAQNCAFVHNQFHVDCNAWNSERNESNLGSQLTFTSLLMNPASQYKNFADLQILVYKTFRSGPLETLRRTVLSYIWQYERLVVISGTVNDVDHNGLADDVDATDERIRKGDTLEKVSTHIFVVLIRCANLEWSDDGHSCKDASQTRVLAFLLPNVPDDLNCLDPITYLGVNTARIRDIELLTGIEFFTSRSHYPQNIALQLRTHIPDEIWPTV